MTTQSSASLCLELQGRSFNCWSEAPALDIWPQFLWVSVKIITISPCMLCLLSNFTSACRGWCQFSSLSSLLSSGHALFSWFLLYRGVYPETAALCHCHFRGHPLLNNAQDRLLKICQKLFCGSGQCEVCCKGICIIYKILDGPLGKIQGDGRKFLDRFKSYFGSQLSSQSLNEIHIYWLQPKSTKKGEFKIIFFAFDCFELASGIANGEWNLWSAAR